MVPKDPNYLVLATDYKTYSLVYACTNYGSFNVQFAWILTRTPTLDATKTAQLRSTLNDFGIHSEKLTVTDQSCWQ